jgi:CheY-like chemotaxis protein
MNGDKPVCSIDTSKRYVLVVEDNTMISMILEELLKKLEYQAILAENGQLGVEKFTKFIKEG